MNWRALSNPAFLAALLTMTAAAIGMQSAIDYFKIHLRKKPIYADPIPGPDGKPIPRVLAAIPTETEHFVRVGNRDEIVQAEMLETLGTDNYLTRLYAEKNPPDGQPPRRIQLHLAYYTGMIDTVPHVPDRCFVGGGMSILGGPWTVPVPLSTQNWLPSTAGGPELEGRLYTTRLSNQYSTAIRGQRVHLPRDLTPTRPLELRITEFGGPKVPRLLAGYFFVANGGWVSSAEGVRLLAFDLREDYAYYLKVQVASNDVSSKEELASLAGALLDDLLGEIMTCVPDWTRVKRAP